MAQQSTLFDLNPVMTISEVANTLRVSEASVRNWIKTGHLLFERNVGIPRQSFEYFRANVAGKDKLTKRANKSLVDNHDHDDLVAKTQIALNNVVDIEDITNEYQRGLSDAYRNKEGIYYTPESICDTMFSDIPKSVGEKTFCDPCCGSGNFIMAAIRHGFLPKNVYGYDTDPTAGEITKRRIFEKTGYITQNIVCADFLDIACDLSGVIPAFDVMLTNPPWGKKLQKTEKTKYGRLLGAGRSLDTSSLFFFATLKILNSGGFLALLLPESFFKIAAFQDARRQFLRYSIVSIRDFDRPFKGLLTKAQSLSIKKAVRGSGSVLCVKKDRSFERTQVSFSQNPASIINFESCPEDTLVLSRLFSKPYVTLDGNAQWGLGIVTGNNKKFCQDKPGDGLMPVYRGVDIHKGHMDEPTTFIPRDISLYQQVAPVKLFEARKKILYRFISSDLVFYHDKSQSYCLNSVNMMILSDDFSVSTENIVHLFNTGLFNWVFGKLFNTHKILRSDLEKMPIPVEFLQGRYSFSEECLLEYYRIERGESGTFRTKR